MACCLDVFITGNDNRIPAQSAESATVRFLSESKTTEAGTLAAVWNRIAGNCEADLFTMVDARAVPALADLENICLAHDSEPFTAALLFSASRSNALVEIWNRYPTRLAALIHRPRADSVAVISKSALEQIGNFSECEAPVWDWLIRATQKGNRIETAQIDIPDVLGADDNEALPLLLPGVPGENRQWLKSHLLGLSPDEFVHSVSSDVSIIALTAGLFQLHDFLDESHKASQSIEGRGEHANGDYWHAIMHRREPDYSNSKYWYRRVGKHPIFERLARQASELLDACPNDDARIWKNRLTSTGRWNPLAFVELCEFCAGNENAELARTTRQIQWAEMLSLLEQTYDDAG